MAAETQMHVRILSVTNTVFDGGAAAVYARNELGDFEIQPDHDTLVSVLPIASLTVVLPGGSNEVFAVHGGLMEVKPNDVLVLVDAIEAQGDIDETRAKGARDRAEKRLAARQDDAIDRDRAADARKRALLRLMLKSARS